MNSQGCPTAVCQKKKNKHQSSKRKEWLKTEDRKLFSINLKQETKQKWFRNGPHCPGVLPWTLLFLCRNKKKKQSNSIPIRFQCWLCDKKILTCYLSSVGRQNIIKSIHSQSVRFKKSPTLDCEESSNLWGQNMNENKNNSYLGR